MSEIPLTKSDICHVVTGTVCWSTIHTTISRFHIIFVISVFLFVTVVILNVVCVLINNVVLQWYVCHLELSNFDVNAVPFFIWALVPLVPVADLPGRRALRSAGTSRLSVPSVRLCTISSRAFPVAGPRIWNALPQEMTSAQSLSLFRQRLKSHLFRQSYPDLVLWCFYCPTAYVNSLTLK